MHIGLTCALTGHMAGPGKGSAWSRKMFASVCKSSNSTWSGEFAPPTSVESSGSPNALYDVGAETTGRKAWRGSALTLAVPTRVLTESTGTWPIESSS